jgi:O-antigen/teichoic acid export membrane protein
VIFAVQDFVLCGLHRASWTPPENLAYSIGRLVLLVTLVSMGASGLYVAWTLPAAGAAAVVTWLLFRRVLFGSEHSGRSEPFDRRRTAALISSDYLGSLTQTAAIRLLPLLIVASLGEASSAYFYVAWTVVFAADTVLANVVTAVTVDGATSRARMARNIRFVLRRGGALVALGVVAVVAAAGPVLGVFSHEYRAGTLCLQLLALSLLPRFVLLVTAAAARHERQPGRIVVLQVVPAALTIVGAALAVSPVGISGVAAAYLLAQLLTVAVCGGWLRPWLVSA